MPSPQRSYAQYATVPSSGHSSSSWGARESDSLPVGRYGHNLLRHLMKCRQSMAKSYSDGPHWGGYVASLCRIDLCTHGLLMLSMNFSLLCSDCLDPVDMLWLAWDPDVVSAWLPSGSGTLRFVMRRLRAVACGPGRRSTSVMLGHACETLAVMYLQLGAPTAENKTTTHRTRGCLCHHGMLNVKDMQLVTGCLWFHV
jgi:hypothetical protein